MLVEQPYQQYIREAIEALRLAVERKSIGDVGALISFAEAFIAQAKKELEALEGRGVNGSAVR